MGVPGLLLGLQSFVEPHSVRAFAGRTLAVDASGWLHRSVYSVADTFVEAMERNKANSTPATATAAEGEWMNVDECSLRVATTYVVQRCQELLQSAGVRKIYLVMDGKRCPMKAGTNTERELRRRENLAEARRLKQQGERVKSFEKYKACIKVPSAMATAVAHAVQRTFVTHAHVEVIWSPYEADAQMVQLILDGRAHAVVTEDSDVLVYQAACGVSFPILFKLNRQSGSCDVLSLNWLFPPPTTNSRNDEEAEEEEHPVWSRLKANNNSKKMSVMDGILQIFMDRERRHPGMGARLFVQACILTGCDYLPNELPGVGLVNAFKLIRQNVHRAHSDRFRHVLNQLPAKAKRNLNKIEYEELLSRSEAVFYRHMIRPIHGTIAFLCMNHDHHQPDMDRFGGDWSFIGNVRCSDDQVVPVQTFDLPLTQSFQLSTSRTMPSQPPVWEKCRRAKSSQTKEEDPNEHNQHQNNHYYSSSSSRISKPISNPYLHASQNQRKMPDSSAARMPLTHIDTNRHHNRLDTRDRTTQQHESSSTSSAVAKVQPSLSSTSSFFSTAFGKKPRGNHHHTGPSTTTSNKMKAWTGDVRFVKRKSLEPMTTATTTTTTTLRENVESLRPIHELPEVQTVWVRHHRDPAHSSSVSETDDFIMHNLPPPPPLPPPRQQESTCSSPQLSSHLLMTDPPVLPYNDNLPMISHRDNHTESFESADQGPECATAIHDDAHGPAFASLEPANEGPACLTNRSRSTNTALSSFAFYATERDEFDPQRQVDLDVPVQRFDSSRRSCPAMVHTNKASVQCPTPGLGSQSQPSAPFNYYDDFMCSPDLANAAPFSHEELLADAIVDAEEENENEMPPSHYHHPVTRNNHSGVPNCGLAGIGLTRFSTRSRLFARPKEPIQPPMRLEEVGSTVQPLKKNGLSRFQLRSNASNTSSSSRIDIETVNALSSRALTTRSHLQLESRKRLRPHGDHPVDEDGAIPSHTPSNQRRNSIRDYFTQF